MLAWFATREIRILLNPYLELKLTRSDLDTAAPSLIALLLLWLLTATGRKTYARHADERLVVGLFRVAESAAIANTIQVILTFFSRHFGADLSRGFILLFAPISLFCLVASQFAAMVVAYQIERWWPWRKRIAVLGFGNVAHEVAHAIRLSAEGGASLCGVILPEFALAGAGTHKPSATLPVLGTTRELAAVINREGIDRIIVACDTLTEPEVQQFGEISKRMGVTVSRTIPTVMRDVIIRYQNQYGMHLVDLDALPFTAWQEVLKRGFDIVISFSLILVLLPLFTLIGLLIRGTSSGPILYRSRRVGKGGRYFNFWKFRSMVYGGPGRGDVARQNEAGGHLFKMRRDPRVTPVGRLLRRFSLDELPQLFNVLAGDMSVVGPRPLPSEDLDPDGMSREFREWAEHRAKVRPGITGLWQVKGRSDVPFDQMVELDLDYIRNWSLGMDMSILLATPRAVISGRGAY